MQNQSAEAAVKTAPVDTVHSIAHSAITFFSGTALSRITGMIRDVLLAFSFGTHETLAAFFVAFRLSQVCRRLFGEGALQSAFVPLFESIRKKSPEKAFFFFRDINALWSLLLSCFVILAMVGLWAYMHIASVDDPSKEVLFLTILMLPSLLPICLFGLNISLLQCEKKFFTAGVAPVAFNVILSTAACLLRNEDTHAAIPYLAFASVIACTAQWLYTFLPVMRLCSTYCKEGLFRNIQLISPEIKKLWKPLSLGILGVGASQINNTIDTLFARYADPEGPAQLWFSIHLQQLPLALFGIALSGALLPPLSRAIQAENKSQYLTFLEFATRKSIALLLPCTAYLLVLGASIVHCIYGRGDFQSHSVLMTTGCLQGYAFSLVPMGLIIIFAPAFFARHNYSIPMKGAVLSLILNALLDSLFVFGFEMKAISVALATSISSWINVLYLSHQLHKKWGSFVSPASYFSFVKLTFCSLGALLCTFLFLNTFQTPPTIFHLWAQSCALLPQGLYERISWLIASSLVFGGSLLTLAKLVKADDLLSLLSKKGLAPTSAPK